MTPEYNGTMPAVLNNAIDWLSRPYGAGAIVGKPFAAVGATPTPYGGKWSHEHARHSATIAGAQVVDGIVASEPAIAGDLLADDDAVQRLVGALAPSSHTGRRRRLTARVRPADGRVRSCRTPRPDRARAG